jgi:uncharacterized Tic20 family protein
MTENAPIPPIDPTPVPPRGGLFDPPYTPTELAPPEERTMGMLCHLLSLCSLVGIPFGNIIGPLVIWLVKKDTMPFVNDQGKESLNFQISTAIICLILAPLICLAGIGLILIIPVIIAALVFTVIATVKANQGVYYRYPFALRLIK